MATAQKSTELPLHSSRERMMDSAKLAFQSLKLLFHRLLIEVGNLKQGADNLKEIEALLNKTVPITKDDLQLSFAVNFFARPVSEGFGLDRRRWVSYLRSTGRQCLVLLLDGPTIEDALEVAGLLRIRFAEGTFVVSRCDPGAARAASPPRRRHGASEAAPRRDRGGTGTGARARDGGDRRRSSGERPAKPAIPHERYDHLLQELNAAADAAAEPAATPAAAPPAATPAATPTAATTPTAVTAPPPAATTPPAATATPPPAAPPATAAPPQAATPSQDPPRSTFRWDELSDDEVLPVPAPVPVPAVTRPPVKKAPTKR